MKKVKIGVFGGGRGFTMIEQLLHNEDAELVAVCDKFEPLLDRVKDAAKENNITVATYTDFDEFLKHDMDAVVLANYATEHSIYACKCLNAGKHVMSEVLPCETMAQAVELIETVERTGLIYTYAENYSYMKAPLEMWQRYKRGDIGEVMYAEGEYIHDCTSIWPDITYGEKDHWRNRLTATFYNTHSLGPIITTTGLRPIKVTGFETNHNNSKIELSIGCVRGAGIEMVTLENGAIVKSVHGHLKREPGSCEYQIYGTRGMMESKRYNDEEFNLYVEGDKPCEGNWEKYDPKCELGKNSLHSEGAEGHGGSDFYPTHFFIEKILGRPEGEWTIDVYQAVDMGICGILAWRSVMEGNRSVDVPNLRLKEERDKYRNDNWCTSPEVAGKDQLWPISSYPTPDFPDSVYEHVKNIWLKKETF